MLPCPRRAESAMALTPPESDHWREDGTCSYCGSMNPDEFMSNAEADVGKELGPTDKNYKVYVGDKQKFYFMHLSVEQKKRFVDLFNDKKLRIGYPGHFYNLPYFMRRKEA